MKRKIIWFTILSLFVLNLRLVIQPEYDHYVIASRVGEISIVFSSKEINAIWVGETMFSPGTQEEYENL